MRTLLVFLSMTFASIQSAQAQPADVASHVAALKGKTFWLKIAFVEVNDGIRGVDAANVLENGEVSYRATIGGFRQSQSQSVEDFAEEARNIITRDDLAGWSVRVIQKGAKAVIREAEAREKRSILNSTNCQACAMPFASKSIETITQSPKSIASSRSPLPQAKRNWQVRKQPCCLR